MSSGTTMSTREQELELAASRNLTLAYIGAVFPLMFWLSVRVVNHYAEPDFPRHTFKTLYVAFFCSFSMFMLIPIDIASSVRDRNAAVQDGSTLKYKDDTGMMATIYFVFYVTLLIWNNVVLAMQEYYNTDGYFTPGARSNSSFKRWLADTVPAIVIGLIVLGLLIGSKEVPSSPAGLKIVLVTLTTAIYETMLMFLLGYGYVEFPKLFWIMSNPESMLLRMQAKVSTDFKAFQEAQLAVQKETASVLKTKEKVGAGGEPQVQEALSIMLAECPQEFKSARMGEVAAEKKTGKVSVDTLAALRTRLNITKATYRMAQARLENTQLGSYKMEDIVDAKNRNNRRHDKFDGQKVIHWQLKGTDSSYSEYKWLLERRPFLCRIAAGCAGFMSLLSIIGAMSSLKGVPKQSSMFFLIVHMPVNTRGGIAFFIALTFGYSVLVTLWALMQLRSLGFELVAGRTTPYSLSAYFRMVASVAFPLTFFYLGWLGENGTESEGEWMYFSELRNRTYSTLTPKTVHAGLYFTNETHYVPKLHHNVTIKVWHNLTEVVMVPTTGWMMEPDYMPAAFAQFYKLPPSTNKAFGSVYPVALLIFLIMFLLQVYNRLMVCLKAPSYQFGDPVVTKEQLDEGMKSLNKYRKIAQRTVQRQELAKKRAEKDADRSIRLFGILICKRETLKEREDRLEKEARDAERKNRAAGGGAKKSGGDGVSGSSADDDKDADDSEMVMRRRAEKAAAELIKVNIPQPAHLTGTTHLRGTKPGSEVESWIEVYMEVRPPGTLYILKDINCTDEDPPILDESLPPPIDLISVILTHCGSKSDSKGRVAVRLEMADSSIKFRLPTADDAKHWAQRLTEWKEFSVLYKEEAERVEEHRRLETERKLDEEAHALFYAPVAQSPEKLAQMQSSPSRKSIVGAVSLSGMSSKVFAPKEPMTINPMRLAGSVAARYNVNSASAQLNNDVNLEVKPDTVEGWLELKSFTPVWFGNKYKRYYFRIHEATNSMQYFHDDVNCDDESPVGFLDLTVALEAAPVVKYKDARDLERFTCQVNGLKFHFKAPHANEAKLWVRLINLWREYLLIKFATTSAERVFKVQKIIESKTASEKKDKEEKEERTSELDDDLHAQISTADTAPLTTSDSSAAAAEAETTTDDVEPAVVMHGGGDAESDSASSPPPSPLRKLGHLKMPPRQSQALRRSVLDVAGLAEVELGGILSAEAKQRKQKRASLEMKGNAREKPSIPT